MSGAVKEPINQNEVGGFIVWPPYITSEDLGKHINGLNKYAEELKKIPRDFELCQKCQCQGFSYVLEYAEKTKDTIELIVNLTNLENHGKVIKKFTNAPGNARDRKGETSVVNGNQHIRAKHKEETANKGFEEQAKKFKSRSEELVKEIEDQKRRYENEVQALVQEKFKFEKDVKRLSEKYEKAVGEKTRLEKEVQRLSEKLSDRMSEQVARNEKHIENVSIKNRPMNIADEYAQLRGENWLNVKSLLDDKIAEQGANIPRENMEEFKYRCLCTLLLKAEACSKAKYNEMIVRVFLSFTAEVNSGAAKREKIAGNAIVQMAADSRNQKWTEENVNEFLKNIPESLKLCVSDMLRVAADEADISAITQEICEAITQKQASSDQSNKVVDMYMEIINDKVFEKYIEECARLTWKMILQRPPMKFDVSDEGKPFKGDKIQEIWFSSVNVTDKKAIVRCYVHPALYHEENLMAKGVVYINVPKKV